MSLHFTFYSLRITYHVLSPSPTTFPFPGVTLLSMNRLLRRSWVIAALLVLGVLIAGCLLGFRPYHGPAIVVVSAPDRLPAPNELILNRIVPYSWGWFWRFKQAVFGGPKTVNLEASIISFEPSVQLNRSNLNLGKPTYVGTNGIQVWVMAESDLKQLSGACLKAPGAQALAKPRIRTADAIGASLFCGESLVLSGVTNSVGVSFDSYPRVHREVTDLMAKLLISKTLTNGPSLSVRTNMDVTAWVLLQRGNGFFLLDAGTNRGNGKPIGVIVLAKVPKK